MNEEPNDQDQETQPAVVGESVGRGSDHTLSGAPCWACANQSGCAWRPVRSVYVASSWRNDVQPVVVEALRFAGLEVFDFREDTMFRWSEIGPEGAWSPLDYLANLEHEVARSKFRSDLLGMLRADACLMVQPCGISSALEVAWFAGAGKPTAALLHGRRFEPELMLGLLDSLWVGIQPAVNWAVRARVPADVQAKHFNRAKRLESGL